MADNEYGADNAELNNIDDEPMAEGNAAGQPAENEAERVNFNINIPYQMRYFQHQMQPAPAARPYYGDWARVERDYRAAAEERVEAAARADRQAEEGHEAAGHRGERGMGAPRSVSPVPPLPFAPEEMSDDEPDRGEEPNIHDLAHAIDNINVQGPHERQIRQMYDRDQMRYDRHNFVGVLEGSDVNSSPPEPRDTYTP